MEWIIRFVYTFLLQLFCSKLLSSDSNVDLIQQTGYPTNVQVDKIKRLHSRNDVILLTPLGFTTDGDALNVHSEQLAAFTAAELKASKVVYFSSHPMVL